MHLLGLAGLSATLDSCMPSSPSPNTAHSEKWVVVWDTTRVLVSTLPPVLGNTHAEVPLSQYANRKYDARLTVTVLELEVDTSNTNPPGNDSDTLVEAVARALLWNVGIWALALTAANK